MKKAICSALCGLVSLGLLLIALEYKHHFLSDRFAANSGSYNLESDQSINIVNPVSGTDANADEIISQNYKYALKGISKTKEISKIVPEQWLFSEKEQAALYNGLTDDNTFLLIELTITNLSDEKQAINVGNHTVHIESSPFFRSYRLCYFDQANFNNPKDYYKNTIDASDTIDVKFGYLIEDDVIDHEDLTLLLNMNGYSFDNDSVIRLRINT